MHTKNKFFRLHGQTPQCENEKARLLLTGVWIIQRLLVFGCPGSECALIELGTADQAALR